MRTTFTRPAALCCLGLLAAAGATAAPPRTIAEAMKRQDVAAVRQLVGERADVNVPEPDGATALHWAAYWDDGDAADLLIRSGANANAANENAVTPLSLACTNGSAAMVGRLLSAGAEPDAALPTGETPLMTCARTGNAAAVEALLGAGANVNARESVREQTALMWAVSEKHLDVARTLLGHGADVHARSKGRTSGRPRSGITVSQTPVAIGSGGDGGFTPLLFAARAGDESLVRLLLGGGADVNEIAQDGSTPLLIATLRGHVALALFLLEHGADPNAPGPGYSPLHWAAGAWDTQLTGPFGIESARDREWSATRGLQAGKLDLVKALLARGANPNARLVKEPPRFGYANLRFHVSLVGGSPYLLAAMAGDVGIMRLLAAHGADTRLATNLGTTPLMFAAGIGRVPNESFVSESSSLDAVKLALELGSDVNAVDEIGDTALHGAAHIRSDQVVQFLVQAGAKVNAKNKRGLTPLMIAEGAGNSDNPGLGSGGTTGELLRKLGAQ
jgi:ankyrin repeat protein